MWIEYMMLKIMLLLGTIIFILQPPQTHKENILPFISLEKQPIKLSLSWTKENIL